MFVAVILSHRIIVTIQKKNDMQQYLLQIKNVVSTVTSAPVEFIFQISVQGLSDFSVLVLLQDRHCN